MMTDGDERFYDDLLDYKDVVWCHCCAKDSPGWVVSRKIFSRYGRALGVSRHCHLAPGLAN